MTGSSIAKMSRSTLVMLSSIVPLPLGTSTAVGMQSADLDDDGTDLDNDDNASVDDDDDTNLDDDNNASDDDDDDDDDDTDLNDVGTVSGKERDCTVEVETDVEATDVEATDDC